MACRLGAQRKSADHQRRKLKRAQRDPVCRAVDKAEYGWNEEIVQAGSRDHGDHGRLPESAVHRRENHEDKMEKSGERETLTEGERIPRCRPPRRPEQGRPAARVPASFSASARPVAPIAQRSATPGTIVPSELYGVANEKAIKIAHQRLQRRQSSSLPINSISLSSKVWATTIRPICASNWICRSFLLISADKGNR